MNESQLIDRLAQDLPVAGHFVRGVPGGSERGFIVKAGDVEFYVTVSAGPPAPPLPDQRSVQLLHAAQALLEARRDQMVTAAEWERLQAAVENSLTR